MKRTYKNNRKYKKKTNKRRRKSIKKMKGGDSVNIVAYKSIIDPSGSDSFNYKVISRREFPKTIVDTIVYQPFRDVEESLAEINHSIGLSKADFGKYPDPVNTTTINITYEKDRTKIPIFTI